MYLTADSLIGINNITAGSGKITLRKVNVKPYGFHKMYMHKKLVEDRSIQLVDKYMLEMYLRHPTFT